MYKSDIPAPIRVREKSRPLGPYTKPAFDSNILTMIKEDNLIVGIG